VEAMSPDVVISVVLPVYDEAGTIEAVLRSMLGQRDDRGPLDRRTYEVVVVDNNSTDGTGRIARKFAEENPTLAVHVIEEPEQGVSCARRAGMDYAVRRAGDRPLYLVSADADCLVDRHWLWELRKVMDASGAAIGVCDYYYPEEAFAHRPLLWDAIDRTLRCRHVTWRVFGGFPDGKGFAVTREAYERAGGIEISYQLKDGRFVNHLSDDWDFGIRVRALGGSIVYAPESRVEINPRRVDHALEEVITGKAYGSGGIITMRDIRPAGTAGVGVLDQGLHPEERDPAAAAHAVVRRRGGGTGAAHALAGRAARGAGGGDEGGDEPDRLPAHPLVQDPVLPALPGVRRRDLRAAAGHGG
jgi:GT2 family glycosyltransferase